MTACSNDDYSPSGNNPLHGEEGSGVYMSLNIEMPSGNSTRSQTTDLGNSTGGTEVGTNSENNVASVLIVIAKKSDNSFIFAGTVPTTSILPDPSTNSYNTTAKFEKSDLVDYYSANLDKTTGQLTLQAQQINVFAICNPPTSFSTYIENADLGDTEWYNQTLTLTETKPSGVNQEGAVDNSIWSADLFTMSNAEIASKLLPPDIDDWDKHKTAATAFNLSGVNHPGDDNHEIDNSGAISVERLACRFDFKDGSGDAVKPTGIANTYNVVYDSDGVTPMIQVELTKMMLTNMAKEFYLLPRVSTNGQPNGSVLCGKETRTNYVVGPNAAKFNWDTMPNEFVFADYFTYPFFTPEKQYNFSNWAPWQLKVVLDGNDDNLNQEYKVWRYATENVIPGGVDNQTYGKTTIIAFKGKLKVPEALKDDAKYKSLYDCLNGSSITGNPDKDPILYELNGNLYISWEEVRKAAIEASVQMTDNVPDVVEVEEEVDGNIVKRNKFVNVSRFNALYLAVFGDGGMGTFTWGNTTYQVGDGITPEAPEANTVYVQEPVEDINSSNYLWAAWDKLGKPSTGNAIKNMRAAMTAVKFTLYQSSTDAEDGNGYYCYYFYRNRHNDNLKSGEMGPMEFATVRNNVYKLAVTNISQLGHPRLTENDPEPPTPDTPDESDEVYLTVTCEVLPWAVRVNNIEF